MILFLDNIPCQLCDVNLSTVKLRYFPPNTTAKLQPLDQGIIKRFKTHYRKNFVKHIIACCTTTQTLYDIKPIYLDSIYWIDASWKAEINTTIRHTFRAASFESEQHK